MYWRINGDGYGGGDVYYHDELEHILLDDEEYYGDEIYTQRFYSKWVYRGDDYAMVMVDTHTDGNRFLAVFDNSKELHDDMITLIIEELK